MGHASDRLANAAHPTPSAVVARAEAEVLARQQEVERRPHAQELAANRRRMRYAAAAVVVLVVVVLVLELA